jgi:iron complex outermembrane receptor protein
MDLGIDKATNPALKGKKPIGSSSTLAKASLQYAVPGIDGLVLSGGIYYSGKKYKDSANLQKIDGYTLFDLGASYRTRLANRPTVFNLYVSNVTNKNYWSSYWQLGLPRTISFSLKTEF